MNRTNQAMTDLLRYNNALLPQKRSRFDKSHSVLTCMDSAYLVPIDWDLVLPCDEKEIRVSALARMATPIVPTMDSAHLYIASFFVPHRLWWSHARNFYGENLDADFNDDGEYEFPYLKPSQYHVPVDITSDSGGTHPFDDWALNDYFGFPVISDNAASNMDSSQHFDKIRANAGLHRCYQLIWNEYFRNSSVQPALQLSTGDSVTDAEWSVIRKMRKVNKTPDFFTSLLRRPQAGADVSLPLGEWAPVVTRAQNIQTPDRGDNSLRWLTSGGNGIYDPSQLVLLGITHKATDGYAYLDRDDVPDIFQKDASGITPANLWANLTDSTAATINNLRSAITIQHLLEVDSIAGKRYQQILQAHWNCITPDATLQRPELLGITKQPIGMRQVLQTSATGTGDTPQGNLAAFSATNIENEVICNKAFTEPGFIIHMAWIRPEHSYSQGLDPLLSKLSRYEQYWPVFDNIGNQPVYKSAIFMANNENTGYVGTEYLGDVLGYEEAWTSYRVRPNRVSSKMRPDVNGSLAVWNYTTSLIEPPVLNSDFIQEDESIIERTIAVQDEPQFLVDVWFDYKDTKNMGVHSTPGITRL